MPLSTPRPPGICKEDRHLNSSSIWRYTSSPKCRATKSGMVFLGSPRGASLMQPRSTTRYVECSGYTLGVLVRFASSHWLRRQFWIESTANAVLASVTNLEMIFIVSIFQGPESAETTIICRWFEATSPGIAASAGDRVEDDSTNICHLQSTVRVNGLSISCRDLSQG